MTQSKEGVVCAVCADAQHNFSKPVQEQIDLVAGLGVKGDAHYGKTVQHLYDKKKNPEAPNLRQVHLMHAELHDALATQGFHVSPGQMGENITVRGIDLLSLPRGTRLRINEAVIEITGLRNPCRKLNGIQDRLMAATLEKRAGRAKPFPLTGVMGIIIKGGTISAEDLIEVHLPQEPHLPLEPV